MPDVKIDAEVYRDLLKRGIECNQYKVGVNKLIETLQEERVKTRRMGEELGDRELIGKSDGYLYAIELITDLVLEGGEDDN
jgi:hypothetical protein